ncbi:RCC1-like G exchanging factor-like protein isoform X2 [Scyliorhinus canicula]|uniref:RCC1-like G exchanging factor-like protein isoform X2 n=1 Tax=Scyliorhinus canicula TaxID=7830 RepID=UPI0018F5086F|nr:RCC1-like G exchanging factor-like protein isoform X2 [Scyliorhinus canicula]
MAALMSFSRWRSLGMALTGRSLRSCGSAGWQCLQARGLRQANDREPISRYMGKGRRRSRLFVWGFAQTGALGLPQLSLPRAGRERPRQSQLKPRQLELDERISSAACGYGFTLLASQTCDITKVWGMGLNKDSQIGFHRSRRDRTKGYEFVLEPSPVPLPLEKPQETRVVQVSCGRAHSLLLTDNEGVFSMGNNAYGQCGRRIVDSEIYRLYVGRITVSSEQRRARFIPVDGELMAKQVNVPKHLPFTGVGKIMQVACGGTHAAILNREGNVFVWGYGILGKGCNLSESKVPEMILPTLFGWSEFTPQVQVNRIRCGLNNFAAITNCGELFVWGKNLRGCLGIGRMDDQYFPWRVAIAADVVDVACGVDHMVALTRSFI